MTYGHWLAQAHTQLQDAAVIMSSGQPEGMADLLATLTTRRAIYLGLARHIELLAGDPPAPRNLSPDAARKMLADGTPPLTRLYVGLRATSASQDALPAASPASVSARALRSAGEAIAIAGDVLAGHVHPGRRPRTPEGAAIRAGGGLAAGLADIARLTQDGLAVDEALQDWVRHGSRQVRASVAPLLAAARPISGRLSVAAQAIVAAGDGHTPLLRLLDTAPATGQPVPEITSVHDADSALRAVRTWLWQNPSRVCTDHLRAGSQLGLAIATLTHNQPATHAWKQATTAIASARGSAPQDEARHAAATLVETLRWARNVLHPRHVTQAAREREAAARQIEGHLPLLAAALHAGANKAVERGELFVAQTELRKPGRAPIFYATPVWQRATVEHGQVVDFTRALQRLAPRTPIEILGRLPARDFVQLAFPPLLRLTANVPLPPGEAPSGASIPGPNRPRTR